MSNRDLWNHDFLLYDGDSTSQWKRFDTRHRLSDDARRDQRSGDDRREVLISWAVPVDRSDAPARFWAFFPTNTSSLVPGVLNAPWKTNEDRQNLLEGRYNDELIEAVALLICEALPHLCTPDDPGRHLDALPRRHEPGDGHHADHLRSCILRELYGQPVVPDQDGTLQRITDVSYPPRDQTSGSGQRETAMDLWVAHRDRPRNWLHPAACTRNRQAAIDRIFLQGNRATRSDSGAPSAAIGTWLEALTSTVIRSANALHRDGTPGEDDADSVDDNDPTPEPRVAASMAAVRAAALIPSDLRRRNDLGRIVLTAASVFKAPDPGSLFFPEEGSLTRLSADLESFVHSELMSDSATVAALEELGISHQQPQDRFSLHGEQLLAPVADTAADNRMWELFWELAREVGREYAKETITRHDGWREHLRVLTRTSAWKLTDAVLMPGPIVAGDGRQDDSVTVDISFHQDDLALLHDLGIRDRPAEFDHAEWDRAFVWWQHKCEADYRERSDLPSRPRSGYMAFAPPRGVAPLTVFRKLSEPAAAAFTLALLDLPATYRGHVMEHTTRGDYPSVEFDSLAILYILRFGRILTPDGLVPFRHALGSPPNSPEARDILWRHRNSDKIWRAFGLSDPPPELQGETEPVPLVDAWPGLRHHLPSRFTDGQRIDCERITVAGLERELLCVEPNVYLSGELVDDDVRALEQISSELNLGLTHHQIQEIVLRRTPEEIEARRADVRKRSTDAGRLLAAVGETRLHDGLPAPLVDFLRRSPGSLEGIAVAEASIATHHTDALWVHRDALEPLDPPRQWAGSRRAIEFVRSLGFSSEWAGERNERRPPYERVDGPMTLPPLHDYQKKVVGNIRQMLSGSTVHRRGMVSMPTGSGKTRVAVQAIVEAIRDNGFRGCILWVADRDELCEQAVEAWRQAWRSLGNEDVELRISRMWGGQPKPAPLRENHVVVGSVQTLYNRLAPDRPDYDFVRNASLVVFDEAHRSIAPTSTSVMSQIGLTFRRREDEPFLIGLTATPYRARDAEETERLVRRYSRNRLDNGAFANDDPRKVVREIQSMGVLAKADQKLIAGGSFELTEDERKTMERFRHSGSPFERAMAWLPASVEGRIGREIDRTRRIVDECHDCASRSWPTLVFATSVEHSATVAALLNQRGVVARSVNANTRMATRRQVVEGFRSGEIQVLVNYGVFREGFDAPKTRTIIVARPVYSPNLYFQMIGRGLRGPLNGGNDRCLILNVQDNIDNFEEQLAFTKLDWLWER